MGHSSTKATAVRHFNPGDVRFGSFASEAIGAGQECGPLHPESGQTADPLAKSALCRYCCKSLFALVITIPPGCRRDFRVKMWGTSSPDDKLTGDLGNVIETTQIGGRRSDRLTAGNLSPGNFGLLQHNLPIATECSAAKSTAYSITSSARASSVSGTVRLSALAVLRLMISS